MKPDYQEIAARLEIAMHPASGHDLAMWKRDHAVADCAALLARARLLEAGAEEGAGERMKPHYDAIAARLTAATPGKWWVPGWVRNVGKPLDTEVAHVRGVSIEAPPYTSVSTRDADATFIANAPTDIAALLARARLLEDAVAAAIASFPAGCTYVMTPFDEALARLHAPE